MADSVDVKKSDGEAKKRNQNNLSSNNKMPFEMNKLTGFPMERLCYDLKLEVIKEMDAWNVIELVKVNEEFRSILMRDPWRVFGSRVHRISYNRFCQQGVLIEKFGSGGVELEVERDFNLIKRVRSCHSLDLYEFERSFSVDKIFHVLNQLESVDRVSLTVDDNRRLMNFLANFNALVKEDIILDLVVNERSVKESLENFIVNQCNACEMLSFRCFSEDQCRFFYDTLSKTRVKKLQIWNRKRSTADPYFVPWVIDRGLPSRDPEAVCFIEWDTSFSPRQIERFLYEHDGMQRVEGDARLQLIQMANECFHPFWKGFVFEKSSYFRYRIDSKRDCIFVVAEPRYQIEDGVEDYDYDVYDGFDTGLFIKCVPSE